MLPFQSCTEWGLQRVSVAGTRVSSYLAFPSLPAVKRAVYFCCTFPEVASAGCYPALRPVVLGLSSPAYAGAAAFLTQKFKFVVLRRYSSPEYKILPQFSHSTMPSVVAIFLSITIGSDILHPLHFALTTQAIGTA